MSRTAVLILATALIVRLLCLFIETPPLRSDSLTYNELAKSLLAGEYSLSGNPTAFVVPGYPAFLVLIYSLFGEGQVAVRVVQSVADVFTCWIFFLCCRKIFEGKMPEIALAVFAFFPSNILFTQTVLTETLFGLFAMLFFFAVLNADNPGKSFLSGIVFGLALLIRSSFAFSFFLLPIYMLFARRSKTDTTGSVPVRILAMYMLGALLIITPWLMRNKVTLGALTLATQGGSTLWEGNNPDATGTWNKKMVEANPLFDEPDEVKREAQFREEALSFIAGHPLKFIELGFRKLGYFFSGERMAILYFMPAPEGMTSTEVYRTASPWLIALVNIPYFVIMLSGVWGFMMPMKHKYFTAGFVIAWMATMFIFVALSRYHYVIIPFFVIAAVNCWRGGTSGILSLNLKQKISGAVFTLFLLAVWFAEFYLFFFGTR